MAAKSKVDIDYPTTEAGMLTAAIEEAQERGEHDLAATLTAALAKRTGGQFAFDSASGSTFAGGGDGRATAQADRSNLISEKQIDFIKFLTRVKTGIDLNRESNAELLDAVKKLTKKQAHERIDALKAQLDYTEVQAATAAQGHEPIPAQRGGKREPVHYPTIPAGWYRIDDLNYKVSQPTKGNWVGWTFIEDEHGDKYRGGAAKELLDLIASDPFAYATAYGKATSVCGCCSLPLEHPASVELGIGPICAEKYGYGEVYADTAARLAGKVRRTRKTKIETTEAQEANMTATTPTAAKPTRSRAKKSAPEAAPATEPTETTQEASKPARKRAPKPKPEVAATATVDTPNAEPGAPQGKHSERETTTPNDAPVTVRKAAKGKAHTIPTPVAEAPEAPEAAPAPVAPKPIPQGSLCEICGHRRWSPKVRHSVGHKYCQPCLDEAEWENEHSDDAHDAIASGEELKTVHKTKKAREEWLKDTQARMAECWVCHPELNKATTEPKERRAGASKAGMVIHAKGSGTDRAAVVLAALEAKGGKGKVTEYTTGTVKLEGKLGKVEILMTWLGKAHSPDESRFDGKRVKNVATCLRMIAAAA